ncbi:UDP-glucose 4-epimerase [Mycobacterium sp. ACS1612]|uniref:NAD-dependent epimerase/dehydratase family protein n=1 Tax=Mycobacterium sp. ACS1612 TaxID=1834117 RepID=UPI0008018595|nr:NAD-dependent epimerase/dehydratase family protein [Mycobacterium sp. ACS1612]OBF41146.1 UDP-glucose 4-epimerase [Mycobacterium sp. ACS1612]
MRALVTGAAGFIGSNLVDGLLASGYQVVGVDNLSSGSLANLEHAFKYNALSSGRFIFLRRDIQAPDLKGIVAGCNPDVIFHLAAQVNVQTAFDDPQFDARSNVLGTINLCEASRHAGVRRIVYAASQVSGSPGLSPCAVGKLAGEMYLRAYAETYGLAPICLALSNVYGPRQNPHGPADAIWLLGEAMITGQPPITSVGGAALDFIYVSDVVQAFMRAGCAPIGLTGTYQIGTGQHTTSAELRHCLSAYFDEPSTDVPVEDGRPDLHAVALTDGKAERELGWAPTVDLLSGIGRTMHWLCGTLRPDPSLSVGA